MILLQIPHFVRNDKNIKKICHSERSEESRELQIDANSMNWLEK